MAIIGDKSELPRALGQLGRRVSALFFKRLVLFEEEQAVNDQVRHYDYDCEGAEVLLGFFKKKQQALLVRAMNCIREAHPPLRAHNPTLNEATKRTNLNSTFVVSDASPIRIANAHSRRTNPAFPTQNELAHSRPQKSPQTLQELLSRVKLVNSNAQTHNPLALDRHKTEYVGMRENGSFYEEVGNSRYVQRGYLKTNPSQAGDAAHYKYFQSQMMSTRNSRRQFIMEKFSQIENSLHCLNEDPDMRGSETSANIAQQLSSLKFNLRNKARPRS